MMKEISSGLRKFNDQLCSVDGLLRGFCKDSTTPARINYLFLIGFAIFVQYLVPIIVVFLVLAILLGNVFAIGTIAFISLFNPIAFLAIIPVVLLDIGIAIVFFIGMLIATVLYCIYFFRKISYFSLLPLVMWVIAFILSFLPVIGNVASMIISLMPWMAIAVGLHWFLYRSQQNV